MRKRYGNVLIAIVAFVGVVMIISSAILSMRGQNHRLLQKAINAGDTDSYITIANLCADAFVFDLDSQTVQRHPSIERPTGYMPDDEDILDCFQEALNTAQLGTDGNGWQLGDAESVTGKWQYKLTNPKLVFDKIGVEDEDGTIKELQEHLLESATTKITVDQGLTITGIADKTDFLTNLYGGANKILFYIDPITFTVEVKKGNLVVTQHYELKDLLLLGTYDDHGNVEFNIECVQMQYKMDKQSIERLRLGKTVIGNGDIETEE